MIIISLSVSPLTAPGPVGEIEDVTKLTSILLTWSAPQAPNGVIISYEVTYRVNNSAMTVNTTDASTNYTIESLTPGTNVSGISVTAFTRAGRGETRQRDNIVTTLRKLIQ